MTKNLIGGDSIAEAAKRSTGAIDELAGHKLLFAHSAERATRAILVVDVVRSVRLIEHDEEGVIARWLSLVNYVEVDLLAAGAGRLVKYLGTACCWPLRMSARRCQPRSPSNTPASARASASRLSARSCFA